MYITSLTAATQQTRRCFVLEADRITSTDSSCLCMYNLFRCISRVSLQNPLRDSAESLKRLLIPMYITRLTAESFKRFEDVTTCRLDPERLLPWKLDVTFGEETYSTGFLYVHIHIYIYIYMYIHPYIYTHIFYRILIRFLI